MKLRRLIVVLLAMVAGALTIQNSRANDTNAASAGTIEFQFINAPCTAMALWLARLTAEPVVVPVNVDFRTTYRTEKKLTKEEAIQCLGAILHTNGMSFVNMDHHYYRVVRGSGTDPVVDHPHIEVEVQDNGLLVNGLPVGLEELSQTLARQVAPETEIWIHHVGPKSHPFSPIEVAETLRSAPGLNADKIYLECMPSR